MATTCINVRTVTVGSATITGVTQVTFNERQTVVGPGITGDTDIYDTFADIVGRSYSFSVTTVNPAQAKAAKGASGTLTLLFNGPVGQNDFKITASAGAKQAGDISFSQPHRGAHTATINFVLIGANGSTDPAVYSSGSY